MAVNTEIEIDEFFLSRVLGCRGKHNLRVQSRGIYACSGIRNNFFDERPSVKLFLWIRDDSFEIFFKIIKLILLAAFEVYFFTCFLLLCVPTGFVTKGHAMNCKHDYIIINKNLKLNHN